MVTGQFTTDDQTFNAVMLTEDFGIPANASTRFLSGVAFNDSVIKCCRERVPVTHGTSPSKPSRD